MKTETVEKLKQYHQEHLLEFLPLMNEQEQKQLEQQISEINFEEIKNLYETTKQTFETKEKVITSIPYVNKDNLSKEERKELENIAIPFIKQGKYAVVTMAGGQGTRLRASRTKRKLCFKNNTRNEVFV